MKKSTYYLIYIVAFFLICAAPLFGMRWYQEKKTTENTVLASKPSIKTEDGKANYDYLPQLGEYFSDHFAGRQELVTANALLRGRVFGESSENIVLVGKEDWLFYKDSLDDYLGKVTLSDRGVHNVLKNLSLMQEYVQKLGKKFVLAVPPNKNTIYPEYMPDYLKKGPDTNNLAVIERQLELNHINYVDLKSMFLEAKKSESEDTLKLFHKGDSHWNNLGAAMAQNAILTALEKKHTDYSNMHPAIDYDFEGDLDKILYPLAQHPEEEYSYERQFTFQYEGNFKATTDMQIETANQSSKGTLVMFRDSFGNSLVPFMAEDYKQGIFTKTVPYRVDYVERYQADAFVLEVVERNIDQLGISAPVLNAPVRSFDTSMEEMKTYHSENVTANAEEFDGYLQISGQLDPTKVDVDSNVYVAVTTGNKQTIYEATPVCDESDTGNTDAIDATNHSSDYGYTLYLNGDAAKDVGSIVLITKKDGSYIKTADIKLDSKERME